MPTRQRRDKKKNRRDKEANGNEVEWKDIEQILLEAEIIARWAKNPFYIT